MGHAVGRQPTAREAPQLQWRGGRVYINRPHGGGSSITAVGRAVEHQPDRGS